MPAFISERCTKRVCAVFIAAAIITGVGDAALAVVIKNQTDRRVLIVLSTRIIAVESQATAEVSASDLTSSSLQRLIKDGSIVVESAQ